MKTSTGITLKTLVLLAFCVTAKASPVEMDSARHDGEFFAFETGPFWLQNMSVAGSPLSVDLRFNPKWGFTVPLGWELGNGFSVAFSGGYYGVRIAGVVGKAGGSSQSAQVNGGIDFVPLMASVAWRTHLSGTVQWYVGLGAGAVHERGTFSAYDNASAKSITYGQLGGYTAKLGGLDESGWHLGFEAFTGLVFDLSEKVSLTLGYRYLRLDSSLSVNGVSAGAFNGHSGELGLHVRL